MIVLYQCCTIDRIDLTILPLSEALRYKLLLLFCDCTNKPVKTSVCPDRPSDHQIWEERSVVQSMIPSRTWTTCNNLELHKRQTYRMMEHQKSINMRRDYIHATSSTILGKFEVNFSPRLSSGVGLRSSTLHRRLVLLQDLWSNERQFSFYNLKFIIQSDMMYKNQYLELNI